MWADFGLLNLKTPTGMLSTSRIIMVLHCKIIIITFRYTPFLLSFFITSYCIQIVSPGEAVCSPR